MELIKGKIQRMSPAPNVRHQSISWYLNGTLFNYFRNKPCRAFTAPFDVRLYWLIYPYEQSVHQFVLNDQTEKYELMAMFSADDSASPALFPDLAIDLAEVFAE